jgi:hypothetical protein
MTHALVRLLPPLAVMAAAATACFQLALPLPGMPDTCSSVGTVAKHSRCPPLRPCLLHLWPTIAANNRTQTTAPNNCTTAAAVHPLWQVLAEDREEIIRIFQAWRFANRRLDVEVNEIGE